MLRVDALEGLARESDTSVLEQVRAWDNADVLLKLGSMVESAGARLVPERFQSVLGDCARRLAAMSKTQQEGYSRFCEPFDGRLMKLSRLCEHTGIGIDEDPGHAFLGHAALRIERWWTR